MITIMLCFFLLPSSVLAQGKGYGIEARLTSQKLIEAEPGKIVTGSYLISNSTGRDVELVESLNLPVLPEKWQPLAAYEHPIILGSSKQKVRLVTFVVPRSCPAGKYEVVYSLTDRTRAEIKAVERFSVLVLPVVKFEALVEYKPEVVMAGDDYKVRLRLVNNGNSTTAMKLNVKGYPDYPMIVDPIETVLETGGSKLVNLFIATDKELTKRMNHTLTITTEAKAPNHEIVSSQHTILTEIMPKLTASIDMRHRIPSQIRFIAVGDKEEDGLQMEYSGTGSLDEAGRRRIDFIFRGPDTQGKSVYGARDALQFNYSGQFLNLHAGDRTYALSPLTERFIYARGVDASIHPEGFDIGSFYAETRWEMPQKKEIGAYASCDFNDKFRIRGNFLNKQRDETASIDGYEANIYSFQANINPDPRFNLGLEYGYCLNETGDKSDDLAHRITLDGQQSNRLWYTFENTYAGPGFLGYYKDVLYSNGSIAASIYRNLRGNLSYRYYKNNIDSDPAKITAPREQSVRGGLSYPFASGTSISLDYELIHREDELSSAQYDFDEGIWRFGLGQSFNKFRLQANTERAILDNKFQSGSNKTLERYNIFAYFCPTSRQSYSIYTSIGHKDLSADPARATNIGASASLQLMKSLGLSINYQKNNLDSDKLKPQDYLFSTVNLRLPNKHSVFFRARWFKFEDVEREDFSFYAAYTIPFNIPAAKKKSIGILKGMVSDRDRAGIPPLKNVILTADGLSTMTNEKGEYTFPVMKAGSYALRIDQKSIGFKKTTTEPLPILVKVQGGKTSVQEIGIVSACRISGRVVLYAIDPEKAFGDLKTTEKDGFFVTGSGRTKAGPLRKDDLKESGGLHRVLVQISRGKEVLQQYTDDKGGFSFRKIRPGEWQLRVYDQNLPMHHYLEKEIFQITLKSGAEKEITPKVLPRLRSVRIIDEGEIR